MDDGSPRAVTVVFRAVRLPAPAGGAIGRGALFLHAMPGRDESIDEVRQRIRADGIELVVSLTGPDEIAAKSPAYAAALDAGTVPCPVQTFPIPDFGVPEDREAFRSLAVEIAARLRAGGRVLLHCGAGIGRTGTLATFVLLALGVTHDDALRLVADAGSHPETDAQRALVSWCAARARLE